MSALLTDEERADLERAILQRNALWRGWKDSGVPVDAEWMLTRVEARWHSCELAFRMECVACGKWCSTYSKDGPRGPRILTPGELPREEVLALRDLEHYDPEIPESMQEAPCSHLGALHGAIPEEVQALWELETLAP